MVRLRGRTPADDSAGATPLWAQLIAAVGFLLVAAACGRADGAVPAACGFPAGSQLEFSADTTLAAIGLGSESTAEAGHAPGHLYIMADPHPKAGGEGGELRRVGRQFCFVRDDAHAVLVGDVPQSWQPPSPGQVLDPAQTVKVDGPCRLTPLSAATGTRLYAPYTVVMERVDGAASASLAFEASGWTGQVATDVVAPDGPRDAGWFDSASLNRGQNGISFNVVGTWKIALHDAHCSARFNVEVLPSGG